MSPFDHSNHRSAFGPILSVLLLSCMAACRTSPHTTPESTPAAPANAASIRQQFLAAMRRVSAHESEPADSPELKRYPIYDYLLAARLQRDLEAQPSEALDARVDGFLSLRTGLPVARRLRMQWLTSLATRHRWELLVSRAGRTTNAALSCDLFQARLALGALDGLAAEAVAFWLLPQQPPAQCTVVFAWLRSQGLLTASLAENRARAALTAGNVRVAQESLQELPQERAAPLWEWLQLLQAPGSALERLARNPTLPVTDEALLAGFSRVANSEPDLAARLLPHLLTRRELTLATTEQLRRLTALGAAYSHNPDALAQLRALPPSVADFDVLEWRVRAAIWSGDYDQARAWIEQMPPELAQQPRWRYWRARAVRSTSGAEDAAPLLMELAQLRDFYGYLAADLTAQPYSLNAQPLPSDAAEQAALGARSGLVRAHELFECDMSEEAGAEWAAVLDHAAPALKVQAALLAMSWGWYAQSIATLAQSGEWNDVRLRYPRAFSAAVSAASQLTNVPEDWLLAIMRQESLFRPTALSRAGARGLMQLQPRTAAEVALRWHLPVPGTDSASDPTAQIEIGAAYFHDLLERFHRQLAPSLAAYNAGPKSVSRWIGAGPPVEADVWIENIPYGETRSYIQRVCEHIVAYAWVRGAQPARLADLLQPIQLRPAATAASE